MAAPSNPAELPLLATCWTLAGDVLPSAADASSPFPLERRVRAAAQAGYRGIGLWYGDLLQQSRQPGGLKALRQQIDALRFELVELEFLTDWFCEGAARQQSDIRRRLFLHAAAELGARHLKVIPPMPGQTVDASRLVEAFGELSREAAKHGLAIAMEMMPMSALPSLTDNLALVEAAGAANGGLLLDIWHVQRSGAKDFRTLAELPTSAILAVELNDARAEPEGGLFEDTLNGRLPCGEGEFDIAGFIGALWQAGYRGPVGVEILSPRFRALEPEEAARISHGSSRAALFALRGEVQPRPSK